MENMDKAYLDIDELAKKIDARIKELEEKDQKKKEEKEYLNANVGDNIANLDEIIKEIDRRIAELEREVEDEDNVFVDLDVLTEKVNQKLDALEDIPEDDIEKTLYDLEEISKTIQETIKTLEEKKRIKKQKKAMYCDMARKRNRKTNGVKKNNKDKK